MPPPCRIEFDTQYLLEVHYFYQPQGWSTCAAGPGPGPGAGAGDVQLFWNLVTLSFPLFLCVLTTVHCKVSHFHIHNFLDIIWINKYEYYFRIPFWLFKGTQYVVSHFECKLLLVAPAIKWHNFQSISQHKIAVMPSIWVIIGDTISNLWWMPNTVSRGLGFAAMSASEMILTKTVHPCQFQVRLLFQNCWMSSTRISQEFHNTIYL